MKFDGYEHFIGTVPENVEWAKNQFAEVGRPEGYEISPWPKIEILLALVKKLEEQRNDLVDLDPGHNTEWCCDPLDAELDEIVRGEGG